MPPRPWVFERLGYSILRCNEYHREALPVIKTIQSVALVEFNLEEAGVTWGGGRQGWGVVRLLLLRIWSPYIRRSGMAWRVWEPFSTKELLPSALVESCGGVYVTVRSFVYRSPMTVRTGVYIRESSTSPSWGSKRLHKIVPYFWSVSIVQHALYASVRVVYKTWLSPPWGRQKEGMYHSMRRPWYRMSLSLSYVEDELLLHDAIRCSQLLSHYGSLLCDRFCSDLHQVGQC